MTQQYIVGEFSSLLARLELVAGEPLSEAVTELRHEVELSPVQRLPRLVEYAFELADAVCWEALEHGDPVGFCRNVVAEAALRDFTVAAGLAANL
jgi:hypothetical protein